MKPTVLISAALALLLVLFLALGLIRYPRPPQDLSEPDIALTRTDGSAAGTSARSPSDSVTGMNWRLARGSSGSGADPAGTEAAEAGSTTNWLEKLFSENGPQPLPKEALENWFASGRTNAADLLAARQAGGGIELLEKALENFPDDPRVLMAATATIRTDADTQRERLERFKAAAPENPLADYLSALNELQSGQPDRAVADLLAASQKPGFDDYALDAMKTAEELYLHAGKSPIEAKLLAMSTTALPHLSKLKSLATGIAELQGQYLAAGDPASAERLAQIGLGLGTHLLDGPGSRTLIGNFVGFAIEKIVVTGLPAGTEYEFLGGDADQFLAGLTDRRKVSVENSRSGETFMRAASEGQIVEYLDRLKTEGEVQALKWLRQQVEPPNP